MNGTPTVMVKKGGFFSSLFTGVFMFLTVSVVCATALGIFTLRTFNPGNLAEFGRKLLVDPPRWAEILPPALADAMSDRRAFDYAENLQVHVSLRRSERRSRYADVVVEVHNGGKETVSLLAMNLRLEDRENVPVRQMVAYAATPLAIDKGEWFGPLLPDTTRKFVKTIWTEDSEAGDLHAIADLADLRVFAARPATVTDVSPSAPTAPEPVEPADAAELRDDEPTP